MKYINTKLKLNTLTKQQFVDIINEVHDLKTSLDFNSMTSMENCVMIHHDNIIAYSLFHYDGLFEYIYDTSSSILLITIDKQHQIKHSLIDYLIEHKLLDTYLQLDQVHTLDKIQYATLPYLVFPHTFNKEEVQAIASSIKGIGHVFYSPSKDEYNKIKKQHKINDKPTIFYLSGKHRSINTTDYEYTLRNYVTQLIYKYPFSMEELKEVVLTSIVEDKDIVENETLEKLDARMTELQNTEKYYEQQLEEIENEIELLELMNTGELALAYYGSEKEFYEGEQKDIVLALINEELKNPLDDETYAILQDILDQNPEVGNRRKSITTLQSILVSGEKMTGYTTSRMEDAGLYVDSGRNAFKAYFYKDPRYFYTFHHTPSDKNWGRQAFRNMRQFFF